MADSFQDEVSKVRIHLKFDLHTDEATKRIKVPLKLLVASDFSHGQKAALLSERNKFNKSKPGAVISEYISKINVAVKNTLAGEGSEKNIGLTFQSIKNSSPEQVSRHIPQRKAMLSMRNFLRYLKAHLPDNQTFRKELEKILLNPALSAEIRSGLSAQAPK